VPVDVGLVVGVVPAGTVGVRRVVQCGCISVHRGWLDTGTPRVDCSEAGNGPQPQTEIRVNAGSPAPVPMQIHDVQREIDGIRVQAMAASELVVAHPFSLGLWSICWAICSRTRWRSGRIDFLPTPGDSRG